MSLQTKKILFTVCGIFLMAVGIFGVIAWWGPLFAKLFLGLLSLAVFLAGLILFLRSQNKLKR